MIEKIILAILIAVLPLQIGRHFWPDFSYILGLKIDYLSPTLYLQDILIFLLFVCFFKNGLKDKLNLRSVFTVLFYLLFVVLNIIFSVSKTVSVFHWLRITEFIFFGIIVNKNKRYVFNLLQKIAPFWLTGESFLGFFQVWKQSSLGDLAWFLGERSFNILTPGIAKASWLGEVFMRPYGTFSHPNSLAGFILIALIFVAFKEKLTVFSKLSLLFGLLTLLFCFSRTVWLAGLILCLAYIFRELFQGVKKKLRLTFVYLLVLLCSLLLSVLFLRTNMEASSFIYRRELADFALQTIKQRPFFGVGANNFIVNLGQSETAWQWLSFLQPVHNIFLLTGSEAGLIGLAAFLLFLLLTFQRALQFSSRLWRDNFQFSILISLSVILFTGLFDHYWLTLIQNQLLFVLILSLCWINTGGKIEP